MRGTRWLTTLLFLPQKQDLSDWKCCPSAAVVAVQKQCSRLLPALATAGVPRALFPAGTSLTRVAHNQRLLPGTKNAQFPQFPQAAAARSSQHRHKAGLEAHKAPGAPPGTGSFKTRGFIASLPRHFMARLKTELHSLLKKKKIIIIKQNLFLKALLLQVMWFSFVGSAELNTHCFVFQDLSAHRAQPRSSSAAAEPRRAAQTRRPYTQSRGAPARRQLSPPRQHLQLPAGEPSSTQLSPS